MMPLRKVLTSGLFVVLSLGGCSFRDNEVSSASPASVSPPPMAEASVTTNLQVEEVINDGRLLHVVATVLLPQPSALTAAQHALSDPSYYALRFGGYGSEGLVREQVQTLQEALIPDGGSAKGLVAEEAHEQSSRGARVYLALPAEGLTSYQLELLWGAEARAVMKTSLMPAQMPAQAVQQSRSAGPGLAREVRFEGVEFDEADASCSRAGCARGAPLRAVLVNGGAAAVTGIDALVSFSPAVCTNGSKKGAEASTTVRPVTFPVPLKPLKVAAGERRVIKLRVPLQVLQGIGLPWECAPQTTLSVASVEFEPPVS